MVPLLLQTPEVLTAEPTPRFARSYLSMRASYMFIQHRFKMEGFIAILTLDRTIFVVVLHMLSDHFLRVEFTLTHVTLEVCGSMDFLVLRKVAGVTKGLVAKCAFVQC